MKEIIALRQAHGEFFNYGLFIDEDGFTAKNKTLRQKAYRSPAGKIGLAIWNDTDHELTETYTENSSGKSVSVTVPADRVAFAEFI